MGGLYLATLQDIVQEFTQVRKSILKSGNKTKVILIKLNVEIGC